MSSGRAVHAKRQLKQSFETTCDRVAKAALLDFTIRRDAQ